MHNSTVFSDTMQHLVNNMPILQWLWHIPLQHILYGERERETVFQVGL